MSSPFKCYDLCVKVRCVRVRIQGVTTAVIFLFNDKWYLWYFRLSVYSALNIQSHSITMTVLTIDRVVYTYTFIYNAHLCLQGNNSSVTSEVKKSSLWSSLDTTHLEWKSINDLKCFWTSNYQPDFKKYKKPKLNTIRQYINVNTCK